jgi:hypothetical protein
LETGDFEITSADNNNNNNFGDVLASIGELYATLTNVDGVEEDLKALDPKFGLSHDKES